MRVFVAADAATFAGLLAVALFARAGEHWHAPGDPATNLAIAGAMTAALVASSVLVVLARRRPWAYAAAAACGLGFVIGGLLEWRVLAGAGLAPGGSRFADAFFIITGYHMVHVAAGAVALAWFAARRPGPGATAALAWYWHFVDAIWLAIAATFYL